MPKPTLTLDDWKRAIGANKRDKELSRVRAHHKQFVATMRVFAIGHATKYGRVTASDVRAYADRIGVKPEHPNAFSGVFKSPEFKQLGTEMSSTPSRHAGLERVWGLV